MGRIEDRWRNFSNSWSHLSTSEESQSSSLESINLQTYGFVQLDVLSGSGAGGDLGNREWKETARWIKYEEDLEEGADRWGKPHIASLSFHSLIKLRQLIERDGKFKIPIIFKHNGKKVEVSHNAPWLFLCFNSTHNA